MVNYATGGIRVKIKILVFSYAMVALMSLSLLNSEARVVVNQNTEFEADKEHWINGEIATYDISKIEVNETYVDESQFVWYEPYQESSTYTIQILKLYPSQEEIEYTRQQNPEFTDLSATYQPSHTIVVRQNFSNGYSVNIATRLNRTNNGIVFPEWDVWKDQIENFVPILNGTDASEDFVIDHYLKFSETNTHVWINQTIVEHSLGGVPIENSWNFTSIIEVQYNKTSGWGTYYHYYWYAESGGQFIEEIELEYHLDSISKPDSDFTVPNLISQTGNTQSSGTDITTSVVINDDVTESTTGLDVPIEYPGFIVALISGVVLSRKRSKSKF